MMISVCKMAKGHEQQAERPCALLLSMPMAGFQGPLEDPQHHFDRGMIMRSPHRLKPTRRVMLYAIAMADYDQYGVEPSEKLITMREGILLLYIPNCLGA